MCDLLWSLKCNSPQTYTPQLSLYTVQRGHYNVQSLYYTTGVRCTNYIQTLHGKCLFLYIVNLYNLVFLVFQTVWFMLGLQFLWFTVSCFVGIELYCVDYWACWCTMIYYILSYIYMRCCLRRAHVCCLHIYILNRVLVSCLRDFCNPLSLRCYWELTK